MAEASLQGGDPPVPHTKPIVGAIHGAAVGGGLGLALVPDFRVTCEEARFSANFNRLGFHPGFGLTVTLPRLVGAQQAALLFYTGRRIPGRRGGADRARRPARAAGRGAQRGAGPAPESRNRHRRPCSSTRETLRRGLIDAIEAATERELVEQDWLRRTEDFRKASRPMPSAACPISRGR